MKITMKRSWMAAVAARPSETKKKSRLCYELLTTCNFDWATVYLHIIGTVLQVTLALTKGKNHNAESMNGATTSNEVVEWAINLFINYNS